MKTATTWLLCFTAFSRLDELAGLHCFDVKLADGYVKLPSERARMTNIGNEMRLFWLSLYPILAQGEC